MAEYIEREAMMAELAKGTIVSGDLYGMGIMVGVDAAMKKIAEAPAADVVEVVRCRDCKYENVHHAISDKCTWCEYWGIDPDFDDFCSYGERRESDATD